MARGADRPPAVLGAERLARVLDDRQTVPLGDCLELRELRRVAEDVHGQDRFRPRRDRGLDGGRIEVEGVRVDVRENRSGTLVERAVRRGDEGEGRRHHFVPGLDPGESHAEVETGGPARDGGDVRRLDALGERRLEAVDHRPERKLPRAERLQDELLLPAVDPGRREADCP